MAPVGFSTKRPKVIKVTIMDVARNARTTAIETSEQFQVIKQNDVPALKKIHLYLFKISITVNIFKKKEGKYRILFTFEISSEPLNLVE